MSGRAVAATYPGVDAATAASRSSLYFCYMIANSLTKDAVKTHTYIGCSRWPRIKLRRHNRELPGGPKNTKAAGDLKAWRLRLVIGPFQSGAKRFKQEWRARSRGVTSRARRGLELAKRHGVPVYIDSVLYSRTRDAALCDGDSDGDYEDGEMDAACADGVPLRA